MPAFLNGIDRNDAGDMFDVVAPPDIFVNGRPVTNIGQIAISVSDAVASFSGGLPLTATGQLAVGFGTLTHFQNGWPFAGEKIAFGIAPTTLYQTGLPRNADGALVFDATEPADPGEIDMQLLVDSLVSEGWDAANIDNIELNVDVPPSISYSATIEQLEACDFSWLVPPNLPLEVDTKQALAAQGLICP